jgi:hypothetical protein
LLDKLLETAEIEEVRQNVAFATIVDPDPRTL